MIATILYLLSCGGGLGFSLLVGLSGVFYLGISKARLEHHEDLSIRSLDVISDDARSNVQTQVEVIEL